MTTQPRRTPLYEEHLAAGARIVDFAGWAMPVQYSSILAEHRAVRSAAGLFDVSHMGECEIVGEGAEQGCAALFTNDARMLSPGRAQYSLIAADDGTVVDDVIVYRLSADRFLVCLNASNTDKDLAWMRARLGGRGELRDRSDETALLAIQGPAAATILGRLDASIPSIARLGCAPARLGAIDALAARTGYTGEDGFELFVAAADAPALWRLLLDAGSARGLVPCGLGARDTLRIEAALPLYGHELGGDISPFEVRVGWAVKLNRPDMIGYEALRRAKDGGATRRLVGLLVEGGIAREGAEVYASAAEGAARIGHVTSGTHSPTLGRAVAMALVAREAATAATMAVDVRGKRRAAAVTSLPFCVKRASA